MAVTTYPNRTGIADIGYVLPINAGSLNPADATTYYFGNFFSLAPGATAQTRRIYIPKGGTITACNIFIVSTGAGTAETSTISIRLNNTTDTTVTSTLDLSATSVVVSVTNLSIVVADNYTDYIEMKWVTPTWVTNPTGVFFTGNVFIDPGA